MAPKWDGNNNIVTHKRVQVRYSRMGKREIEIAVEEFDQGMERHRELRET